MDFLSQNWFFLVILLACVGMHFLHGHSHGHEHASSDGQLRGTLDGEADGDAPKHAHHGHIGCC